MLSKLNRFANHSLKFLSSNESKQTTFSPLSISMAMNFLNLGIKSHSNSKKQMSKYFGNRSESNKDDATLLRQIIYDTNILNVHDGFHSHIANGVYFKDTLSVKYPYYKKTHSLANFEYFEYESNVSPIYLVDQVNNWIRKETNNKISEILTPNDVTPLTQMIMVNSLYFKALWANSMDDITPWSFRQFDDTLVEVPMMTKERDEYCYYYEDNNVQCIEKCLKGPANFGIILPRCNENKHLYLNLNDLEMYLEEMEYCKVVALIPKFKMSESTDLEPLMKNLGITDIFDPKTASLTEIGGTNLAVDKIIHKVAIDIDLNGIEAAAATAITINKQCATLSAVKYFCADCTFVWYIRNTNNNTIMFCGIYNGIKN